MLAILLPISRGRTYRRGNIDGMQLRAVPLLLRMRHRIRHHHPAQLAIINALDRASAQNSVRHNRNNLLRSVRLEGRSSLDQGTAGIRHVVYEDRNLVGDFSDEDHTADFVGARALLVDEGKVEVEAVGDGRGARCSLVRWNGGGTGGHTAWLLRRRGRR